MGCVFFRRRHKYCEITQQSEYSFFTSFLLLTLFPHWVFQDLLSYSFYKCFDCARVLFCCFQKEATPPFYFQLSVCPSAKYEVFNSWQTGGARLFEGVQEEMKPNSCKKLFSSKGESLVNVFKRGGEKGSRGRGSVGGYPRLAPRLKKRIRPD